MLSVLIQNHYFTHKISLIFFSFALWQHSIFLFVPQQLKVSVPQWCGHRNTSLKGAAATGCRLVFSFLPQQPSGIREAQRNCRLKRSVAQTLAHGDRWRKTLRAPLERSRAIMTVDWGCPRVHYVARAGEGQECWTIEKMSLGERELGRAVNPALILASKKEKKLTTRPPTNSTTRGPS